MNLDLYHAQIGEGNLIDLVRGQHPPGRRGPGRRRPGPVRAGHRRDQLPRGGAALAETGYAGTVAMEAWASGDDETAREQAPRRVHASRARLSRRAVANFALDPTAPRPKLSDPARKE